MVTRWAAALLFLAALIAPTLADAQGVSVATSALTCPLPRVIGISGNPGATCVTGVGTDAVTFWFWSGAVWVQQTSYVAVAGTTTTTNVFGCAAAVIPGVATGQSPLPTCNGGDTVSSVQLPTGVLTSPGLGFVVERWRPSAFYGRGFCSKVAVGGVKLTETIIADKVPC